MDQDTKSSSEQRRFTRVPFDAKVLLTFNGAADELQVYGTLADISLKGLMLAVDQPNELQQGLTGRATVQLSSSRLSFHMDIEIKHIEAESIGLEIRQLPIESAEHLRSLMQHNLGN